jgi:hypothetical protein
MQGIKRLALEKLDSRFPKGHLLTASKQDAQLLSTLLLACFFGFTMTDSAIRLGHSDYSPEQPLNFRMTFCRHQSD